MGDNTKAMLSPKLGMPFFPDYKNIGRKVGDPCPHSRVYRTRIFHNYEKSAVTRAMRKRDSWLLTDLEHLCFEHFRIFKEIMFVWVPLETEFQNGR